MNITLFKYHLCCFRLIAILLRITIGFPKHNKYRNPKGGYEVSPRLGLDLNMLLQNTAELADSHGLDHVTLAKVAHKLGIRSPSIYNHVKGLDDLRNKLAIYGLRQLTEVMTHAAVGRAKDDAVYAIGEAYVTFARKHPGLYESTLRAPDPGDKEYQRTASELVNLVVRVMYAFGLEDDEALHAVRGFRSLLHGFASIEQKGGFGLALDLDVTLHFIIKTFLTGLQTIQETSNILNNLEGEAK